MRKIQEADIKKIIKDLQGNFAGSNEEQMKSVQLLKGLATSDDPLSNEFMKALDKETTRISKEMLKEESAEKKSPITVVLEKNIKVGNCILEAGDTIEILKEAARDTRDMMLRNPAARRKADWDELSDAILTSAQKEALKNIVREKSILWLDKNLAASEPIFDKSFGMEYVVNVDRKGFFYVDTEGFDYARYSLKIPDEFAEKELLPIAGSI